MERNDERAGRREPAREDLPGREDLHDSREDLRDEDELRGPITAL